MSHEPYNSDYLHPVGRDSRSSDDNSPRSAGGGNRPHNKEGSDSSGSTKKAGVIAAIEEEKPAATKEEKPPAVSFLGIFRYADALDKFLMFTGTILACCAGGGVPTLAIAVGRSMNDLALANDPEKATAETALIYTYIAIAMFITFGGFVLCWTISARRQIARIRYHFLKACLRQDIAWHDAHSPGELTARMTGDTRVIHNGINDKLAHGFMFVCMSLCGFAIGFVYCWELTLVMFGMMPVIAILIAIIGKFMSDSAKGSRKQFAAGGAIATEVFGNIRTVQSFGQEEKEIERFRSAVLEARTLGIKKVRLAGLTSGLIMMVIFVNYTISFFFGSYLMRWGRSDMEKFAVAFFSVLNGSVGMGLLSPTMTALMESRVSAFEIFRAIDRVPLINIDAAEGLSAPPLKDSIEFLNLNFAYPSRPDMMLFRNLSLKIFKGQKIAFSGASGCGKSSMIALLQRFYDPLAGAVLCDDINITQFDVRSWRAQIGIVSQESHLFHGTIADNVRLGRSDATDDDIIAACKRANIHNTVLSLPDQYKTQVGSVGSQLSGGQKQRIAIARALIRNPSILLLDEATSALDRKSEVEVQEALDALVREGNMTVIMVAHRLATIRDADCIYYLKYDGVRGSRIVESGTFHELINRGGEFAAMAKTQGVSLTPDSQHQHNNDSAVGHDGSACSPALGGDKVAGSGTADAVVDPQQNEEAALTERQKVPIAELTKWEEKRAVSSIWRVMLLNRDQLCAVILGLIGSFLNGASRPCIYIVFGFSFNVFAEYALTHDNDKLQQGMNLYAPMYLLFGVVSLMAFLLHSFYGYAGEHLTMKIRMMLFEQILRQDMSFFDTPGRDAGSLSGMLSGDCEGIHQLWGPSIGNKVQMVFNIGIGLVIGYIFQWKLALICTACMPIVLGCAIVENYLMQQYTQSKEDESDDIITSEALTNVRTVTSFNLQDNRLDAYARSVAKEGRRAVIRGIIAGLTYGICQFVFYGVWALCFWYGGKLISKGEANFSDVLITTMAVISGSMSGGEAGGFATKLIDAQKSAIRVFTVVDRVPDVDASAEGDKDIGFGCTVEFQKVKFVYPARPTQVVLSSVDLCFRNGTSSGLMGETGCGKSTIIQILARFYDIKGGRVDINGKDLSALDIKEWRKHVSIVLQEPHLFSGPVRENIRYSNADATDAEVEEAARLAHIHDEIIAWPEGYDTDVGQKGQKLSGGQRQRVAIARGLLRRPRLLLLDEATSALDNTMEAKVQRGIDMFQREHGITTVCIAHRLTTIRHADHIVLLDDGRVIEEGSHDDLMKLNREYAARWNLYSGIGAKGK